MVSFFKAGMVFNVFKVCKIKFLALYSFRAISIPWCISERFCFCEIVRNFPPGMIILVVFLLIICILRKSGALHSGN